MSNLSLVAFDTDQIKSYVFATGKLKEIRGASAILDQLNREEMPRLAASAGGKKVYAGGGAGLFTVDSAQADGVIRSVQHAYGHRTETASITGVEVSLPENEEGAQAALNLMRYRLRAAKDGRTGPVVPLTHPLLHFCDSCGTQYARHVQSDDHLCHSCLAKRERDEQVKGDIAGWTSAGSQPDPASTQLWERLIGGLKAQGYPTTGYDRPDSFEDLGRLSSPPNYMGLIYADGDAMGREIEHITRLDELQRFAAAVDSSVYDAVQEATARYLKPAGRQAVWPFDILLLGGDDLVMVTRAQSAVEVAAHIVRRFPELTEAKLGKRLSISASVVLTHINYPFGSLLDLAESGLKFAKRELTGRRIRGESLDGGLINFLVVNSANHLDFSEYYRQTLRQAESERSMLYRTQRPYTWQAMDTLLGQIRAVRDNVPRTKLEQLRAAVFRTRKQGTIDAMMAVLRMRNDGQRAKLFNLVGTTPAEHILLPWVQQGADWVTPVLDIVELLDFVE